MSFAGCRLSIERILEAFQMVVVVGVIALEAVDSTLRRMCKSATAYRAFLCSDQQTWVTWQCRNVVLLVLRHCACVVGVLREVFAKGLPAGG